MLTDIWLQVSVAVLLDNFVSASASIDAQEQRRLQEEKRRRQETRNPLEPLLRRLSREYIDDADLSDRLSRLFQVMIGRLKTTGATRRLEALCFENSYPGCV
jgi:hypothetical protein